MSAQLRSFATHFRVGQCLVGQLARRVIFCLALSLLAVLMGAMEAAQAEDVGLSEGGTSDAKTSGDNKAPAKAKGNGESSRSSGHKANGDEPVLLSADQVTHDRDLGIVTASGNVEISQDNQILKADAVSYNLKTEIMTAYGHVSLTDPTGNVSSFDYLELTGDLKSGIGRDMRTLMTDDSRMAATTAKRRDGNYMDMDHVVYSPCKLCQEDPSRAPLWQIKSESATHDLAEHTITYYNAWMEMFGVPIGYTPYFSEADPTIRRRTGLLTPDIGYNSLLGYRAVQPFFYNIAPNEDLTITPIYYGSANPVLTDSFRRRFEDGEIFINTSVTKSDKYLVASGQQAPANNHQIDRGNIDAKGLFNLDDQWRAGFLAQRSGDVPYMQAYRFIESDPWLTTRPYVEGFNSQRSYSLVEAYSFQGLQSTDIPGQSPNVLPHASYSWVGRPGDADGMWSFNADELAISRTQGNRDAHLATRTGWEKPFQDDFGNVFKVYSWLRADAFAARYQNPSIQPSGASGRAVPEAALEWRFPMQDLGPDSRQFLEPMVQGIVSPYGGNSARIANEDSQAFEFDDTNLFSLDRFAGYDRIETGPRANYGLRYGYAIPDGPTFSTLFGQSYRVRTDNQFPVGSGMENNLSNYVARFDAILSRNVDLAYQTRTTQDLTAHHNDIIATIGPPALRFSISYVYFDNSDIQNQFGAREQLWANFSSALSRYWTVKFESQTDLTDNGGPLSLKLKTIYEDECYTMTMTAGRNYTYGAGLPPSSSIFLDMSFKNVGDWPVKLF